MADDLERVRKLEMQRGRRRPIDFDAIEERRRQAEAIREILRNGTLEEFKDAMRVFGLSEEMEEWSEALRVWNAERGRC